MQHHVTAARNNLIVAGTTRRGCQPNRRGIEIAADGGRTAGQIEQHIVIHQIKICTAVNADHDAAAGQSLAAAAQNNLVVSTGHCAAAQIKIGTVGGTAGGVGKIAGNRVGRARAAAGLRLATAVHRHVANNGSVAAEDAVGGHNRAAGMRATAVQKQPAARTGISHRQLAASSIADAAGIGRCLAVEVNGRIPKDAHRLWHRVAGSAKGDVRAAQQGAGGILQRAAGKGHAAKVVGSAERINTVDVQSGSAHDADAAKIKAAGRVVQLHRAIAIHRRGVRRVGRQTR